MLIVNKNNYSNKIQYPKIQYVFGKSLLYKFSVKSILYQEDVLAFFTELR